MRPWPRQRPRSDRGPGLLALRLGPTASSRLLAPGPGDVLDDLVVDVRVGDNNAAAAVAKPNRDGRALLLVADLLTREITDKNGLPSHGFKLRSLSVVTRGH